MIAVYWQGSIVSIKEDPQQLVIHIIRDLELHFHPHRVPWMQQLCIQCPTDDAKGTTGKCSMYVGVEGHRQLTQGHQIQTLGTMCQLQAMNLCQEYG